MFHPMNKYLLVRVLEEEKTETGVLVPDDFKVSTSAYSLVQLLRCHASSKLTRGDKLVVPRHMIEEINLFGENYSVVLENHVIGFFDN